MKLAVSVFLAGALAASAQTAAPAPKAGQSVMAGRAAMAALSTLPATPPANTSTQDIVQFEKNMRMMAAYLAATSPAAGQSQVEANRAMVQRMAAYMAGLQALSSSNSKLRPPINRAQQSFNSLGFLQYLALADSFQSTSPQQPLEQPPPQPAQNWQQPPPFVLTAPESTDVSDADKDVSAELHTRYDTDAAHSAGVWQNAETLRQNLAARGLGLNVHTATALVRLPLHFNSAANALRRNDWDAARTHLEQAEAETEKIATTVGK